MRLFTIIQGGFLTMKKKPVTLRQILVYDFLILVLMGGFMFFVETRVTEYKQRENLFERLDSIQETFNKSYQETLEVTELYDDSMMARANALTYLMDHDDGFILTKDTVKLYDVDNIYIGDYVPRRGFSYYTVQNAKGQNVTLEIDSLELQSILSNIYSDNRVLQRIISLDDMFLIVTNDSGEILYFSEADVVGKDISVLGISLDDLVPNVARWMRLNRKTYYASSVINENLSLRICCGITSDDMTLNSHIAISLIFAVICLVFTVIITYTYFSRQQAKKENGKGAYSNSIVRKKLTLFSLVGLILIGLTTYYIQTLFYLSLHSISTKNEISEITSNAHEAENAVVQLTEQYNHSYLNKARIASDILSRHPELRTKEELARLSKMMDFEFIMMFDTEGNETLSDSYIVGFSLSDDPADQSYQFNVLKNGIPYVVQEAQNDELTGTYRQYIGVLTYDVNGVMDGFLQVAVSPEKLASVIEETSLNKIMENAITGTDDEAFAIDSQTGCFTFASNDTLVGQGATDFGVKEENIRNNYYGYMKIDGVKYYLNSFELNGQYVYVGDRSDDIFEGRTLITVIAQIVGLINMMAFGYFINHREVVDAEEYSPNLYVDVEMANGERKQTLNIVSRVLKQKIIWSDKTPEDKTGYIIRIILAVLGVLLLIAMLLRGLIYTEDSIFGFIISGKWERGINVFAFTVVLIYTIVYFFIINLVSIILNEVIKMVNPKNETIFRLIKSFVRYVGTLTIMYIDLSLLGFDSQSLLASAGLLTLVVGLGAKDLVTDILAGVFIIFENEFQVGDIIEVNGYKGRVIEIGIRTTRIINTIQDIKSINNRNLTNIVNKTRRNSYCDIIINVPFDQNIDAIEEMLRRELPKIKDMCPYIIDGPNYGGVDDMSGRFMRLSIRTECLEAHKFDVRTVVNREIKDLFDKNGFKLC